jgi:hypothetical protein
MGKFGLAPATLVYENRSLAWEIVGRRSGGPLHRETHYFRSPIFLSAGSITGPRRSDSPAKAAFRARSNYASKLRIVVSPPKAGVKSAGAKSEEERVLKCKGLRG